MRKYFFEVLSVLLILGSLGFFLQAVSYVSRHDYVGGFLIGAGGVFVLNVGAELARLALVERD